MKKRLFRLTALLIGFGLLIHFSGIFDSLFRPSTVKAAGDLTITFEGIPLGDPVFEVTNMLPGDIEERDIDVSNGGTISHLVRVKGIRTGGVGPDPLLETVLDFVIRENGTPIYGAGSVTGVKTLSDFFIDAGEPDGLALSTLAPNEATTYSFKATFLPESGNDFQLKSVIFDLIFGDGTQPTPTPTPSGNLCSQIDVNIFGNGVGSVNGVKIVCRRFKVVSQTNTTIINTNINTSSNTGNNTISGNTGGTNNSIFTGITNTIISILNGRSFNFNF